jgi:nucleoside-diphosphate-sugar epimerase
MAYRKNYGIQTFIARFHNIFGPEGSWCNGAEKAPAATCRKVLESVDNETLKVQVWGLGDQTRSFLYIDECVEGVLRLVDIIPGKLDPTFFGPVNIGSDEMIPINNLTKMVAGFAGK